MAFYAKQNIILHQLFGSKKFRLYITIEKSEEEKSSLIQRLKQTLQYFSILTETHTNHDQIHLANLHFGSVSPSVAPARAGEEGKKILLCDYCRRKKDGTQPIGWPRSFSLLEIVTEKECLSCFIRVLQVSLSLTLNQKGGLYPLGLLPLMTEFSMFIFLQDMQIYRRKPMPKCDFNKVEKQLY